MRLASLICALLAFGCSESRFQGRERARPEPGTAKQPPSDASRTETPRDETEKPRTPPAQDVVLGQPGNAGADGEGDHGDQSEEGLEEDDETITKKPRIDYAACDSIPAAGRQSYGQCAEGSVVVVVNDGLTPQMTCCPVQGKFLSKNASERQQIRIGACGAGEVLTGMVEPRTPTSLCSKLAPGLKIGATAPSQYVKKGAASLSMALIVASYNANDTCVCPEGTIALGGHTPKDNSCTEQCAVIDLK